MFANEDWPALEEFARTVENNDTLPPWFQSMVLGEYNYRMGYYYRGTGWANSVTEAGWKKLEEHSIIAHKHFERALEANPLYPESAVGLMGISTVGHSDKSSVYWFDKAIEAEPDYMPAYRARLHSLMPRWGGSIEEMQEFAFTQARKKQYESAVPYVMVMLFNAIRNNQLLEPEEKEKLLTDNELRKQLLESLDGLIQNNEQNIFDGIIRDKNFLATLRAVFLMQTGQPRIAEREFRKLGNDYSDDALKVLGVGSGSVQALMASASAFSAEYQNEATRLKELVDVPLNDRIANLSEIEKLVSTVSPSDESGGLFFNGHLTQVRMEKGFNIGNPVSIGFDPRMNL